MKEDQYQHSFSYDNVLYLLRPSRLGRVFVQIQKVPGPGNARHSLISLQLARNMEVKSLPGALPFEDRN